MKKNISRWWLLPPLPPSTANDTAVPKINMMKVTIEAATPTGVKLFFLLFIPIQKDS